MQSKRFLVAWWLATVLAPNIVAQTEPPLVPVSFTAVKITGGLWADRLRTNREVTLPYTLEQCDRTKRIANFAVAGGLEEGDFTGIYFNDSDVFKVVEGAAYALATHADPELQRRLDALIRKIASSQEDDGYLYTIRTIRGDDVKSPGSGATRWSRLASSHELYNVGHLYEAAVAHHAATGKRTLLDVALKNADLVAKTFGAGVGQRRDVPGHQEIEIGLVKLYRATGNRRWLDLARFFLDQRGRHETRKSYGAYTQDHAPVVEQTEAVGHAVRAGYLYAAMTDVAALSGAADYRDALDALWQDVVGRKLYVTGGVGATHRGEAFGKAYQLPNATAYAETCAAVAQALWSHRMFLLHRDGSYVDVLERILYNGLLSGVSLEGNRFFYPNPLACGTAGKTRAPWFSCSCCPVNVVRVIPSVPGFMYAVSQDSVYVNLYATNQATIAVGERPVKLTQTTDYPWSGSIRLNVDVAARRRLTLRLRIPGWARGRPVPSDLYRYVDRKAPPVHLRVNGEEVPVQLDRGYATITREWRNGDTVELDLPMPVRRVVAHDRIAANRGRVALERGPIVYCLEGIDNGGNVQDLVLEDGASISTAMKPDQLGGAVMVEIRASRVIADETGRRQEKVRARAIPYHLWAHRDRTAMAVWVARTAAAARPVPPPPFAGQARATASHVCSTDTALALNDGRVPENSGDHGLPRHTWWDHRGTAEWVQYAFDAPQRISGIEVYWFDDTGVGQCRVPTSCRVLRRVGKEWKAIDGAGEVGTAKDRFNVTRFDPVEVTALRLEVKLADGFSGGVLEWRVVPAPDKVPEWKPVEGSLLTRWAKDVSPDKVHPEYPRPHLVRPRWSNLNGLWDHAIQDRAAKRPQKWDGRILVPFPVESALSGVGRSLQPTQRLWYRRTFTTPDAWSGQRVLLHFGAVDWKTDVWVDGRHVGDHTGGYDAFTFDLGARVADGAPHEVVIAVWDPVDRGEQPRGKQKLSPGGIWYTPTSGIWQTVWLEPVPNVAVRELKVTPDIDGGRAQVSVDVPGLPASHVIEGRVSLGGKEVARASGTATAMSLPIPTPRLWSPDAPTLYDLRIRILDGDRIVDEVTSYFGMRKISLERDGNGTQRLFLNGHPLFHYGLLDQGFWPDGLYTAPTDEALRYDIEQTRKLGFNLARKHVKIEPERWYWWCDRLGLLVWQDMPSGGKYIGRNDADPPREAASARQFERELDRLVAGRGHHPSIVMWVLFNEGWGQFDTKRLTGWLRERDPTRLVNAASGWTDRDVGHVLDVHRYPGPAAPRPLADRAIVLGEFGGLGLPLPGHTWREKKNWGYRTVKDRDSLTRAYVDLVRKLRPLVARGLSAAVYTQTTDVEIEVNGLLTYDRAIVKPDARTVAEANRTLFLPPPIVRPIVPTSRDEPQPWRYTLERPPDTWSGPDFDAAAWKEGRGGFGTRATPGAVVGTEWSGSRIWLRRSFDLEKIPTTGVLHLDIHHDEDAEVWLNGRRVARLEGYTTGYVLHALQGKALRVGSNTLAVSCRQTGGGQFIDVGLAVVSEPVR